MSGSTWYRPIESVAGVPLSDTIVIRSGGALDGNRDGEWWDVNDIEETAEVTGDADI